MKNLRKSRRARGFLMLEVVLALAVFGIAATGFAVALHRMGDAAELAQREMRITRILENALEEEMSMPALEEGVRTVAVGKTGMELDIRIEPLEDFENEEGQLLQEMFRITVTANWFENGQWNERSVETWRYGRMYQP